MDENTFVFVTDEGTLCDPTNYSSWWTDNRESFGFNDLLTHELRHTQITLLRGEHISEEMIQNRVGHQHRSSVTYRYTHETPANDMEAANVIERILYGTSNVEDCINASAINEPLTA